MQRHLQPRLPTNLRHLASNICCPTPCCSSFSCVIYRAHTIVLFHWKSVSVQQNGTPTSQRLLATQSSGPRCQVSDGCSCCRQVDDGRVTTNATVALWNGNEIYDHPIDLCHMNRFDNMPQGTTTQCGSTAANVIIVRLAGMHSSSLPTVHLSKHSPKEINELAETSQLGENREVECQPPF
jgi:hypothetical protein